MAEPEPAHGRWLVAQYLPCALFALKVSSATSSVGRTLVLPTPYAVKMALVDAAFRAGWPEADCADLLRTLASVAVRISPPARAVVSQSFVKVRQEPKRPDPDHPYISSVAYREFVFHQGSWRWAFDLAGRAEMGPRLEQLFAHVRYVGKRGSFVQYVGSGRIDAPDETYTQPLDAGGMLLPTRSHVSPLDDFGSEADLETLSSYSSKSVRVPLHRRFVDTVVPLGVTNTGPGFTEYARD